MTYPEVLANARTCIGQYCKACPVCNGVACKNQIPGPGAKGVGDTAIRNYNKWADIRVNMDTLCPGGAPDTTLELFGKSFRYPFFAGPVGAVNLHYSDTYTDMTYNDVLVRACAENGIAAFTGDGTNPTVMEMATRAIGAAGGCGVPTIKPWNIDTIREKMAQAKASGCFAVAMDVDAAGLPFLKNMTPPAGSKSVEELAEIVQLAERPFIVKGVMTVKGALKAKQAGAAAIVVSNHGGRVLDQCPATAEVLPEIAAALKGTGVKVLVDGGIHVHGNGKAAAGLGLLHLGLDSVDVPGLDGRHAAAACSANSFGGHGHHIGIGAVTRKGGNAVFGAGAHQHIIVGHIGVGVGIVEVHRTHRACKEGILEGFAKQLHTGVGGAVLAQGVHVHPDLRPLIIIADGRIAHALGTGAGDLVFAGHAVAHGAGLAVLPDALAGIVQNISVIHIASSCSGSLFRAEPANSNRSLPTS